jgi:DnaK suppressor protein
MGDPEPERLIHSIVTAKKKTSTKKTAAKSAATKNTAENKPASAAAPVNNGKPLRKKKSRKVVAPATVDAILGLAGGKAKKKGFTPNGKIKIKAEWQKYYDALIELHERLTDQMHGLAKDSAEEMESYSLHMGDSGTDNFDRDFALSLLSSDQDAVYEIEEALNRIEKGAYGICELTEKVIPKTRLTAIPWTRFTVEAQAQLEREGSLKSRRLGSLGSVDSKGSGSIDSDDSDVEEKSAAKQKT